MEATHLVAQRGVSITVTLGILVLRADENITFRTVVTQSKCADPSREKRTWFSRIFAPDDPVRRSNAGMASMMKHAAARISNLWTLVFQVGLAALLERLRSGVSVLPLWRVLPIPAKLPQSKRRWIAAGLLFWLMAAIDLCSAQAPVRPGVSGAFNDVMVRDRNRTAPLTKIKSLLGNNQTSPAIELLQRVFDAPEDAMLPRSDLRGISLRVAAAQLLRDAGEDFWTSYETDQGAEATKLLDRATANGDVAGYHEVVRRYAHTVAGSHALDRLANWYFDRGDFDLAVGCWNNLLSNPVHAKRITNLQYFKLVIAAARSGVSEDFRLTEQSLQSQKIVLGGQARNFEDWQARLNPPGGRKQVHPTDWQFFGGSSERARVNAGTAPFLRPSFKISLFDSQSPAATTVREREGLEEARTLLEQELSDRRAAGVAFGFAGSPLVTKDWIILRDALGIRVLDRRGKGTLWTYRTKSALTVENSSFNENDVASLRQSSFLYNSVLCQLSCDERQVYLIDQNWITDRPQATLQFEPPDNPSRADGKPIAPPPWNRLVALRLVDTDTRPATKDYQHDRLAWKLGGHPFEEPDAPLNGHFFLGPPLPVGDILYTVSEYQKQFFLTALQPENGHVLWRQTLAYVPIPSRESPMLGDRPRLAPACFIAGARGVLVCPLGAGVLVGLDQLTGEFLWTYDYRWRPKPQKYLNVTLHNSVEQSTEADFPNPPLIHEGHVYYLAPGDASANLADHVHCVDLKTGARIWVSECRDAKYLAVLAGDRLLAVGGNFVQALGAKDGSPLWLRRVPVIAGVGVAVQDSFLLPVNDGRVLSLNVQDGTEIGYSLPTQGVQLGNLIAHGQDVISENGLELQVFPQAAERLAELEQRPEASRGGFADLLEISEVYFRLGRLDAAKAQLKRALSAAQNDADRAAVRQVSRELAWRELLQAPDQRAASLAEFAAACEVPEHFAQYLLVKGEEEIRRANWGAARQTSRELLALNVDKPLRSLDDSERLLTAEAWSSTLADRIAREAPAQCGLLENELTAQEIIDQGKPAQMRSFLLRHPSLPESTRVRLALARKYVDDGQAQAAEFTVWQEHLGSDPAALAACQFLVELWTNAGLYEEAGRLLNRIGTQLADVKGEHGQTGGEYFAAFSRTSLVWNAAQRFVPLNWKVEQVAITERHEIDRQLRGTFNNWPRSLHFPQSSNQ
ncbi:MAG: hypothetical protein JWM11_6442, partial [Planctomycetaceae bacterium]|nr:hypothetical protein [Planctomycetaceae bacterium]